jgi:hypothetical protein
MKEKNNIEEEQFELLLRPNIWIMLIFGLIGYFFANHFSFDIGMGIVIGLLIGFLIILKIKKF